MGTRTSEQAPLTKGQRYQSDLVAESYLQFAIGANFRRERATVCATNPAAIGFFSIE
jgi:hypothetical protein